MPRTLEPSTTPELAAAQPELETATLRPTFSERASGLAEMVREHPKTAIAAGAIVAAGVAAAIPLARRRSNGRANGAGTTARKAPSRTAAKKK